MLWPVSQDCACDLAEWTGPAGRTARICLERSAEIAIRREEVRGFRIEDRLIGDQIWYLVSVLLRSEVLGVTARKLRRQMTPPPESCPPDDGSFCDTPVAVSIDAEPRLILPWDEIRTITYGDVIVALTRDLSRAEAIVSGWGVPITRVIRAEIAAQPIESVSLEDLISNPNDFIGKRVSVRGYQVGAELWLSEEDVIPNPPSPVSVPLEFSAGTGTTCPVNESRRIDELGAQPAFEACRHEWVQVEAFVESSRDGSLELTRIERIESNGTDCLRPDRRD